MGAAAIPALPVAKAESLVLHCHLTEQCRPVDEEDVCNAVEGITEWVVDLSTGRIFKHPQRGEFGQIVWGEVYIQWSFHSHAGALSYSVHRWTGDYTESLFNGDRFVANGI